MRHIVRLLLCLWLACLTALSAKPQDASAEDPPRTTEAALHAMFTRAAVVFTGEVLAVERSGGDLLVKWRVEDAVRGVSAGGVFTQREWNALSHDGSEQYTVGQRALVLLQQNPASGYASPVDGAEGIVPLRGDAGSSTMDLRWIAQHVQVTDTARLRPLVALHAANGSFVRSMQIQAENAQAAAMQRALAVPARDDASPPQTSDAQMDGALVLALVRAWQRTENDR